MDNNPAQSAVPAQTSPPSISPLHSVEIPTLTTVNFIAWRMSVEHVARTQDLMHYLYQPIPHSESQQEIDAHLIRHAQAQVLIIPSLSTEILSYFTDIELQGPLHVLYDKIRLKLTSPNPAHTPSQLRRKAHQIKWQPGTTAVEYVQQHTELRQLMVRSNYPDISDEQTTIRFILEGLEHDPSWIVFLQTISMHNDLNPKHLLSLDQVITMIIKQADIAQQASPASHTSLAPRIFTNPHRSRRSPASQRHPAEQRYTQNFRPDNNILPPKNYRGPWCKFHGSPHHTTENCRARQFFLSRHERKEKPHKPVRAVAVATDPYQQHFSEEFENDSSDNVSAHEPQTFILDSGANPTHLTRALPGMKKHKSKTVTADGHACLLYTSPSPRDGATSRMPSSA